MKAEAYVRQERSRRRLLVAAGGTCGLAFLGGGLWWKGHRPHRAHLPLDGQPRSLTLAWPDPEVDPVLIVARESGFFTRYNLDVTIRPMVTGDQAISALTHDDFAAAVAPALSWLPGLHAGVPARLVAGLSAGTFRLLVRKRSGMTRLEHLIGRTVIVPNDDSSDRCFLSVQMRRKGLNPGDVHWRSVPEADLDRVVAAPDMDAIITHDTLGWQLRMDNTATLFELLGSTTGHYAERVNQVLGLSDRFIDTDPQGAAALTLALRDACRWIEKHRKDVASLLAPHLVDMELADVTDMLAHEPAPVHLLGRWLRDQMAQYADELKLIGRLPDTISSDLFAASVCRDVIHI
ncbi:nitrate/sulfonate/bicarbonate transporter substrate-binding periplasmic protein [Acetobacter estunensis NRIC 0472]|uniref:ABC transporter substrate-binding protein n=1 Tax=Acetobacter estunensis TaxID=104097 RepID=A0A967B621_9PROT|nr:ABC transporter substrate-binding protein [Acetobacter estunensis]NHO52871.1 ABC transporter substrate-binding protein [Acetobacter estunensis]GBQ28467.1 nitrate/sulfonate/bicarbonate transporter substrate-binding periplasmic protein [Acetobacter estunensis NRIC 0472]